MIEESYVRKTLSSLRLRRNSVIIWVLIVLSFVSACSLLSNSAHLKITASLKVDGKVYSASGVQKYTCHQGGGILGSLDVGSCSVEGEAIPLFIPNRGYLFLTMHGDFYRNLLKAGAGFNYLDTRKLPKKWTVAPAMGPEVVEFKDINSAKTVTWVNLENVLGDQENPTAIHVTVEKVPGFVTRGRLVRIIPWVRKAKPGLYLNGNSISGEGVDGELQYDDFTR